MQRFSSPEVDSRPILRYSETLNGFVVDRSFSEARGMVGISRISLNTQIYRIRARVSWSGSTLAGSEPVPTVVDYVRGRRGWQQSVPQIIEFTEGRYEWVVKAEPDHQIAVVIPARSDAGSAVEIKDWISMSEMDWLNHKIRLMEQRMEELELMTRRMNNAIKNIISTSSSDATDPETTPGTAPDSGDGCGEMA